MGPWGGPYEIGSPAGAGIDLYDVADGLGEPRFPRRRGDRPWPDSPSRRM